MNGRTYTRKYQEKYKRDQEQKTYWVRRFIQLYRENTLMHDDLKFEKLVESWRNGYLKQGDKASYLDAMKQTNPTLT